MSDETEKLIEAARELLAACETDYTSDATELDTEDYARNGDDEYPGNLISSPPITAKSTGVFEGACT